MKERIQAIVPSVRPAGIRALMTCLAREGLAHDAIIVDDSVDERVSRSMDTDRRIVLQTHGVGPGAARNRGAAAATAHWLLFVDDDVLLPIGFGPALLNVIDQAVEPVAIVEFPVRAMGVIARPFWRARIVESHHPGAYITACLLVRRTAFLKVGGFSSDFKRAFREDTQLGIRLLESGASSVWMPELFAWHPVERVGLLAFMRSATLFREDALFRHRYPGYLQRTGQSASVGPFHFRGIRRNLGLALFVTAAAAVAAKRPNWALVPTAAVGFVLNQVHLRAVRRAGATTTLLDRVRIADVAAHAVWAFIAGGARCFGHVRVMLDPPGPIVPAEQVTQFKIAGVGMSVIWKFFGRSEQSE